MSGRVSWATENLRAPTYEQIEGLHVLEPRSQYDRCIVGVVLRGNARFVLYDKACVIESNIDSDDEDAEQDAIDHFEFNMLGSWVGDDTPGYIE